ncbi:MAG TPA: ABC transporter ATP-binding protein [Dongiaceae bacterium]|nr:ABC transporter ATP-binding protein [Dongiaceae bacterium]
MSADVAIRVSGLGKRYWRGIGGRRNDTLRDLIAGTAASWLRRERHVKRTNDSFWALKDATFDITRGENVGIIGLNGAGKSTLLKMLSRITTPTEGTAHLRGRVGALLEVGTGFHQELTGRENVFLYGTILGMTRREIASKFDAIVEFAGIPEFIDTPVKRYSSGMYVRLAFAVAAHLDPEILFLDEVLAVGDLTFQRKCLQFTKELQRKQATILFVSHNMFSIKTMCGRVVYLRKGEIQFDGPTDQGIAHYEEDCRLTPGWGAEGDHADWPIVLTDCRVLDRHGVENPMIGHGEPMRIRLGYETRSAVTRPNFIVALVRSDGVACCNYSTEADGLDLGTVRGRGVVELEIPVLRLVAEMYTIAILVREPGFGKVICSQTGGTFHVRHHLLDPHFGVYHEPGRWSWDTGDVRS